MENYKKLIESDQLEELLVEIETQEPQIIKNQAILLQGKLKKLSKDIHSGVIASNEATVERNKIRIAVLNLVSAIEGQEDFLEKYSEGIENKTDAEFTVLQGNIIKNKKTKQRHSGRGDNVQGNKIVINPSRFFKNLGIVILSILIVLVIVALLLKESLRRMLVTQTIDEISYYSTNYQYYRSPSSYSQIQEKYNFLNGIRGEMELSPDQNTILGSSLSLIGNYPEALDYFKQGYQGYKKNGDLQNTLSLLSSYCFCLVAVDSTSSKAVKGFEAVARQFPGAQNQQSLNWLQGDLSLCQAIEASRKEDVDAVIRYLKAYEQNFEPNSFAHLNTLKYNLDQSGKYTEEIKNIFENLNVKYQEWVKYYTTPK